MNDPIYYFEKGKGWVPRLKPPFPTDTFIVGKFRITASEREPENGEHFYSQHGRDALKSVVEAMRDNYWFRLFTNRNLAEMLAQIPKWNANKSYLEEIRDGYHCIVMELEYLG